MTNMHIGRERLEASAAAMRNRLWQLPAGRAAAGQARRAIRDALRAWGLDPVADEVAGLVKQLVAEVAARGRGPLTLRLELREAAHLLLGHITDVIPARPDDPARADDQDRSPHTALAVTYGRRRARGGATGWYTHAFTW